MKIFLFAIAALAGAYLLHRHYRVLVGLSDLRFPRRPDAGKIRVACVGDSITYGALIPLRSFRSWPARLERMAGGRLQAENFGLNGRTLQPSGDRPYTAEKEYQRSLAFSPNAVILSLGTNDTKPHNWKSREAMEEALRALAESYLSLPSRPKVFLCTPTWGRNAKNDFQFRTNDTEASLLPQISLAVKNVAAEKGLPVIDLYGLFKEKEEWLSYDGCHPRSRGAVQIAAAVHGALKAEGL